MYNNPIRGTGTKIFLAICLFVVAGIILGIAGAAAFGGTGFVTGVVIALGISGAWLRIYLAKPD